MSDRGLLHCPIFLGVAILMRRNWLDMLLALLNFVPV